LTQAPAVINLKQSSIGVCRHAEEARRPEITGSLVLLTIAGYAALLLWGLHMVETGITRAFGAELRRVIGIGLRNRWRAFLAGFGITALLQSSTATGLMTTSFIASGLVGLVPALAVILGANVGTTVVVQILSFDAVRAAPLLFFFGVVAFKRGGKTRTRDLGRVAIGLGVLLLALHQIVGTLEPLEETSAIRALFATLTADPFIDILIAALLTWAAYSSVAVVLLVMSLAATGILAPVSALALVLGANLGSILPQYFAAGSNNAARRLALGNLVVRGTGCLLTIPFLQPIAAGLALVEGNLARQAADFHALFNLALALAFIGLLDPLARLCMRFLPTQPASTDEGQPLYIDEAALATPSVALSNAARETLRMMDMVERMLRAFFDALRTNDRKLAAQIGTMDDTIDRLHNAIKLHLTRIGRDDAIDEADARRCSDILAFAINLEHIGDILDKSLREIAAKKIKNGLSFSPEGFGEIAAMHGQLLDDLRLAASVFMTADSRAARTLVDSKVKMRDLEQAATENHLQRLRDGRPESIETSAMHIDIARDLKRIASHLASVAYPILDQKGELGRSRVLDQAPSGHPPAGATARPT
jgi:phosphate:Na+ symporter